MDNIGDPTILTGMAQLVNKRKVNNKLNLEAIERDLIESGCLKKIIIPNKENEYNTITKHIKHSTDVVMDVSSDSSDSSYSSDSSDSSDTDAPETNGDGKYQVNVLPWRSHSKHASTYF